MPSLYEPCGLNQMYSMRYGTVPVVRATGGLDDTVEHFDRARGTGTGFKFEPYTRSAMLERIYEALYCYARARGLAQDSVERHARRQFLAGGGAQVRGSLSRSGRIQT